MGLQNKRERMAVKTKEIMEAAHGGIFRRPCRSASFLLVFGEKLLV